MSTLTSANGSSALYLPLWEAEQDFTKHLDDNISHQCLGLIRVFDTIGKEFFKEADLSGVAKTLESNRAFLLRQDTIETAQGKVTALLPIFKMLTDVFNRALENLANNKTAEIEFSWKETTIRPYCYFFQQEICTYHYRRRRFVKTDSISGFYSAGVTNLIKHESSKILFGEKKIEGTTFQLGD